MFAAAIVGGSMMLVLAGAALVSTRVLKGHLALRAAVLPLAFVTVVPVVSVAVTRAIPGGSSVTLASIGLIGTWAVSSAVLLLVGLRVVRHSARPQPKLQVHERAGDDGGHGAVVHSFSRAARVRRGVPRAS